ncbi:MAG: NACHT domain-containing protein [Alphaproteobacteria bacterium]|nr:NACHT domain-containing protein [Alphaproteobacteria bacterium]
MSTETKNIERALAGMRREVDDLHPHLREFLGKIEGVKNVEYTHGPNEWGADFVLTESDSLTDATAYVGVVVKNGTISQSGVSDVLRQIDECGKPRMISNGAQRVRMDRVWVIANGTISNNAKEKIHDARKIGVRFTDRKALAGLMAKYKYSPSEGLPTSIAICLGKQSLLASALKKESIPLGIVGQSPIFMDQMVIRREPSQYAHEGARKRKNQSSMKRVSIHNALENNRSLFINGEPGCGKSKMLQDILDRHASDAAFQKTKMIPIFVSCQDMLGKHDGKISKMLDEFEREHRLGEAEIEFHYLVIIDGIDECGLTREERIDHIAEWKKESSGGRVKKMVFASRDHFEEKRLDIPTYRIAPLSMREVVAAIKKTLAGVDVLDRIVDDVVRSDIFRSLPQNPLSTAILINLLQDEESIRELPANLTELFSKYAEVSLGRWDKDAGEGKNQRRYEASNHILARIATYMLDNQLHQIGESEAQRFFAEYLEERNLGIDPVELFDRVVEKSNLVFLHDGIFRFRHRTIAEFFYSKSFSNSKIDDLGEYVFDVQWATILFFHVGAKKDCPKLLEKINAIRPQQEGGKIMKAINMANILLAGYATPYACIQKVLQSVFIDTSIYAESVIGGKMKDSALARLSIMHVLAFFRIVMDYEYSRPFFKQAIEESLNQIEGLDIDDNVKAASLFLISLAHRSLGGENIFSGMIEKLGNRIPAHIQLAINHETDYLRQVGKDVKKFKRSVKRRLLSADKRSVGRGGRVHDLYTKEIRYLPKSKDEDR